MAAHQAPPSLGFSRQEQWSGLPFPSPVHESEKWKWSRSVVSNSSRPHGLQPTRLLHPWDFPGKSTGVGCHCLLRISHEDCIRFLFTSINLQWNRSRNNDYNVFESCRADRCMWNNRTESDILLASSGGEKKLSIYQNKGREQRRKEEWRKEEKERKEGNQNVHNFIPTGTIVK